MRSRVDGSSTAGLPDHRRSLSQSVPSRAIAAANREVMEVIREIGGPRKKPATAHLRKPPVPSSYIHIPYLCLSETVV